MIVAGKHLYVGGAHDEMVAPVDAVLNVACDLYPTRTSSPTLTYVHLGLVDGPGNPDEAYVAAVMALASLLVQGKKVLVCCHGGNSRSVAVVLMYFRLTNTYAAMKWTDCLETLNERLDADVVEPHEAHRCAFGRIPWTTLHKFLGRTR